MTDHRVIRGRKSQQLVADWFRRHGWAGAESRPASLPGTDVFGMPGWAPEVKATRVFRMHEALDQASSNADKLDTPFVVYRPPGFGPERIKDWPVVLKLSDFTRLMRDIEGWPDDDWTVDDDAA